MKEFRPRTFKFKAWNKQTGLLMKLSRIDCVQGELFQRGHILLQFTGMYDQQEVEIYEMDVLVKHDQKYLVRWHDEYNGWYLFNYKTDNTNHPLHQTQASELKRLCSYFESDGNRV
ncbi:MAG: hypothetical protein KF687_16260 [Cyclobacteriaceae bacterium]|nr:hypothetical protein [Cyclobacteriaceae bacterium]